VIGQEAEEQLGQAWFLVFDEARNHALGPRSASVFEVPETRKYI
jgi:hypothetical protein